LATLKFVKLELILLRPLSFISDIHCIFPHEKGHILYTTFSHLYATKIDYTILQTALVGWKEGVGEATM
jgi:hypothetical protein